MDKWLEVIVKIKASKDWYRNFYDEFLAGFTLDDRDARKRAAKDVAFLVKELKPEKGMTVLDVPCGCGRHSVLLARKGLHVTGLDISPACVAGARKRISKSLEKKLLFRKADYRNLERFKGQFDITLNLFTSFGYLPTKKENEKVMRQLVSTLKPGGQLCMYLVNRLWLKHLTPTHWEEYKDFYLLQEYDVDERRKTHGATWTFVYKKGGSKKYKHRLHVYSPGEMVTLMERCGLRNIRVFGGVDGSRLEREYSSHPVYIGQKP